MKNTKKSIVIYYIKRNLGHAQIVFSLVKGIKQHYKNKVSIVVIQSGAGLPPQPFKRYCEFHVLPYSLGQKEKNKKITKEQFQKRYAFIKKIIDKTKTDIFVTELYPFGKDKWSLELPHILRYVKQAHGAQILASISYLMWEKGVDKILDQHYDQILCHFPANYLTSYLKSDQASCQGKVQFRRIKNKFKNKMYFTNFIVNQDLQTEVKNVAFKSKILGKHKKIILVSRGGAGIGQDMDIMINLLAAAKNMTDYLWIIVSGPFAEKEKFKFYKNICAKIPNVKLFKYLANFRDYLKAADLLISAAGYNISTDSLYLGKKNMIIPYEREEQLVLAGYLKKQFKIPVILPKRLTPKKLVSLIENLLRQDKQKCSNEKIFQGVEKTIKTLNELI